MMRKPKIELISKETVAKVLRHNLSRKDADYLTALLGILPEDICRCEKCKFVEMYIDYGTHLDYYCSRHDCWMDDGDDFCKDGEFKE